jgi:hypothetical protein
MNEEIIKILKMIEEGKITADQGAELIKAIEVKQKDMDNAAAGINNAGEKKKATAFCIYVSDGDKKEVKVKIPRGLVSFVSKFIPKGMEGKVEANDTEIDLSELLKELENCACGEVISIDKEGKNVRICCE